MENNIEGCLQSAEIEKETRCFYCGKELPRNFFISQTTRIGYCSKSCLNRYIETGARLELKSK